MNVAHPASEMGPFSACLSSDRELIGAEGFWLVFQSVQVSSEMRDLLLVTQPTHSLTHSRFGMCSK